MLINGFQKITVLDYPGKVACTVFTAGCNLRCPFCHNSALVTQIDPRDSIDQDEIFAYLKKRQGILDGVAVTGGEPLINSDLPAFLERIKSLGYRIKLDTNGCFPDALEKIVSSGLVDYVAMDIKNSRGRYAETVGIPDFDLSPVEKSIDFLMRDTVEYEFRTTVTEEFHELSDFDGIGSWLSGARRYFLQSFVDSGAVIRSGLHARSADFLAAAAEKMKRFVGNVEIRGI